jgi:putative addiction module killer protein
MESGNSGAAKALRDGVFELRLDFGPGYRVYYGMDGKTLVIFFGGGDKRRQAADIAAAVERWQRDKRAMV